MLRGGARKICIFWHVFSWVGSVHYRSRSCAASYKGRYKINCKSRSVQYKSISCTTVYRGRYIFYCWSTVDDLDRDLSSK